MVLLSVTQDSHATRDVFGVVSSEEFARLSINEFAAYSAHERCNGVHIHVFRDRAFAKLAKLILLTY